MRDHGGLDNGYVSGEGMKTHNWGPALHYVRHPPRHTHTHYIDAKPQEERAAGEKQTLSMTCQSRLLDLEEKTMYPSLWIKIIYIT